MDKNSINQVARTYQRLVEAAITPKTPPMPLEAPDTDEFLVYDTGEIMQDRYMTGNVYQMIAQYESMINDILEQLANCEQTNNCEQLKAQYIQYTNILNGYRYALQFGRWR